MATKSPWITEWTCCTLRTISQYSRRSRGRLTGVDIDAASLRRARLEAGLSLAQVAGRDLTRQAVHLVETGKTRPSRRTLQIIARRLGVPVSTFLVEPQDRPANADTRASELEHLWRTYRYQEIVQLAKLTLEQEASPRLRALAHHYMGLALIRLDRPKDALDHLKKARELFQSLDDPWFEAESMDWEAAALYLMEDQRALPMAEEALRRYRTLDPRLPGTEARILEHVAMILATHHHSYERAKAAFEEALEVVGTIRDLSRMGRIYHGLSVCYQHIGDLSRATEFAHKALAVFSLEQDQSVTARIENELGLLHMRQGQLDRAEQLFLSALDHLAAAGVERNSSHFLLSLGELRERQGRFDEGIKVVKQAIDVAERLDETMAVAAGYQQLGTLYAKRGEDRLFRESFQRALALLEESGSEERRAECRAAYEELLGRRGGGGKAARAEPSAPGTTRRRL